MTRITLMALTLACAGTASAQDGAPLVDGLGGQFDIGQPHGGALDVPLAPALPAGIRYYADAPERVMRVHWQGNLAFGGFDESYGVPLPAPLGIGGLGLRRIVPFQHSAELSYVDIGDIDPPPPTYIGQFPADEGQPGRFVVTWYRVADRPPARQGVQYNTWQTILTGPDPDDYEVEFRYHRCEWHHGQFNPERAAMGFDGGEGVDGPGWMWPGSLTPDAQHLCRLSNVREPGVFRYRIVDGVPTGCGVDPDPPPGDGRCTDGNHLPGDGCSPACYVEPDIDGDGRFEAPHPDAVDPLGVYDTCTDPDDPRCDDDDDGDGIPTIADNCPLDPNPAQRDYDADAVGDACDPDADGDVLPVPANPNQANRPEDICPLLHSIGTRRLDPDVPDFVQQIDTDGDGLGDPCDPDDDGDGVLDCGGDGICNPEDDGYNNDRDFDTDEPGECGPDDPCFGQNDLFDNDADGVIDEWFEEDLPPVEWPGPDVAPSLPEDNCRRIANPDQTDTDGDGIGDACDPDIDGDGIPNCQGDGICGPAADGRDNDADDAIDEESECAALCDPMADRVDQDHDGWADEFYEVEQAAADGATLPPPSDNCPRQPNPDQEDRNRDGQGDHCDDEDGDTQVDRDDNCPDTPNLDQDDLDRDGIGDACDDDTDGDGTTDARDSCPWIADDETDTDGDGLGDACDPDDDEDGINDPFDVCPVDFDRDQADLDRDGAGDVCDPDDDGDGADDAADACPRVPDDQTDTDQDGAGDACDPDDDGDGINDGVDVCPRIADPAQADLDGDGLGDACDAADDRPFDVRTPAEKCAILVNRGAPTAERLRYCAEGGGGGCRAAPGRSTDTLWWAGLLLLGWRVRSRGTRRGPPR